MGLEIFYDLHAPADWTREHVWSVVETARVAALGLGWREVSPVKSNDPAYPKMLGLKSPASEHEHLQVAATESWYFRTWPGEGCETAMFGLCRFPSLLTVADESKVPTGWGRGWHYHSWCKTQYADRVGRNHFLRCHVGIVTILDTLRSRAVEVNARDASGYWNHRDIGALERSVEEWNRTVAAVAGAIKDVLGDAGGCVGSPVFSRPDFEQLEAEGRAKMQERRDKESH